MKRRFLLAALAAVTSGCTIDAGGESAVASSSEQSSCDWDFFGTLLVRDTASMLAETRPSPGFSTEGGTITTYRYESSDAPNVVFMELYGETGRGTYTFFLESPTTFVVEATQSRYGLPIDDPTAPVVKSISRDSFYFCEGVEVIRSSDSDASKTDLAGLLDDVLAQDPMIRR